VRILYLVDTGHGVYVYLVYAVLSVCCTRCILYLMYTVCYGSQSLRVGHKSEGTYNAEYTTFCIDQ
jgi:hypothetical protein